ncbi:hypothetical protein NKR23_g6704, partial [Pleurostoma richardsiae]
AAAADEAALRCLNARHSTSSAGIFVQYPGAWEGDVEASSMSGSVRMGGPGLVAHKVGGWPEKVVGHKGEGAGGSAVTIKSISGSVDFKVGE